MNIAFFHELNQYSGARKVVDEYGKILSKNHNVDLYYVDEKEDPEIKRVFKLSSFYRFKEVEWKGNNWRIKLYKDFIEVIRLYLLHKKIAKTINSKSYDFVFVNPSKYTQAPFILRFLNTKKVYFCQEPLRIVYDNFLSDYKNINFFKRKYEKVNRFIKRYTDNKNIRSASVVLANSKFSKENIKNAYGLNSFVCYLGVDTKKFEFKTTDKTQDILFVGERAKIDGYDLLENTLALFKNKPTLKLVSRDSQAISEEKLVKEFNNSKIYLALSRNEPFGLSLLEAMACGVPVIAINEGGLRESVIDSKTGYLCSAIALELKSKIDNLLVNEKKRIEFGRNGRKHVLENFTWEKSVKRFLKIVNDNLPDSD